MEKSTKAVIIGMALFLGLGMGAGLVWHINAHSSYATSTTQGVYVGDSSYFTISRSGQHGGVSILFKLDDGETIAMAKTPFTRAVEMGEKVKILYHVGAIFKNTIYDGYEPLKKPFRYWSEPELAAGVMK